MFDMMAAAMKKIIAIEIAQFLHMIDEERDRLALQSQSEKLPRMEGGPAEFMGDLAKGDIYVEEDRTFKMGFTSANRNNAKRT